MDLDRDVSTLQGEPVRLSAYAGRVLLIVNVASECGLTPQYKGLQALHEKYAPLGLSVLGFPCNQFGAQEPGSPDAIEAFCTSRYAVSFPLFEKLNVNEPDRHPLYAELVQAVDAAGAAGDVQWNFEKFLIDRQGQVLRFRPRTEPDDPAFVAAIEAALG